MRAQLCSFFGDPKLGEKREEKSKGKKNGEKSPMVDEAKCRYS
jgi:hypothetical protein